MSDKGETSGGGETGRACGLIPPKGRKGGRKLEQEEPHTASARPDMESLSKGHLQEESHVGQELLNSNNPTTCSHCLGAAPESVASE